jgi:membrane-associated phospholipid phosphatase
MTARAESVRRPAPASLREWGVVFRHAAITMGRAVAILVTVLALARVRGDVSIYYQAGALVVSVACLYLALGSGARAWAFYITLFVLFAQVRAHSDEVGTPIQFAYPIVLEKALFFGTLPVNWLQDAFYSHGRLGVLETYTIAIYLSYFFFPHIAALAIWKWDRQRFRTYVPAFVLTLYIAVFVSAILPTAPPWMASEAGKTQTIYQILPDILHHLAPGAYEQGENAAGVNAVAAMPSLHCAIPWLLAIAAWKYRGWRWLGLWYAASMCFAVVYLGEHYFVDTMAGLATAGVSWLGAVRVLAWWDARTAARQMPEGASAPTAAEAAQTP